MIQKAHTPGPWNVRGGTGIYSFDVVGPNGEDIGYANPSDGADEPVAYPVDANAALMAAAPELLEACKEFVRKCECGEARSVRSYAQMKAAISKALGECE